MRFGLRPDPGDTPFNYSLEYETKPAAEKAVRDLRELGYDAEIEDDDPGEGWYVGVESDVESEASARRLQRYADETGAPLYVP
jgi:hypothetical protein